MKNTMIYDLLKFLRIQQKLIYIFQLYHYLNMKSRHSQHRHDTKPVPSLSAQFQEPNINIENSSHQKYNRVCRICLQTQQCSSPQNANQTEHKPEENLEKKKQTQTIIQLPCSCKGQLGMVHDNCIKFWIKFWLESKIKDFRTEGQGRLRHPRAVLHPQLENANVIVQSEPSTQVTKNQKNKIRIHPIDLHKIKQNTIYPFVCEVCHSQFYFDLIFHRRLKAYFEIKKKQIALFVVSLLFALVFMGICINWYYQSGINIYLIIFFILCWLPMTCITFGAGAWTFTKRQFWIKQIYSQQDLQDLADKISKKQLEQKKKQSKKKEQKVREITKEKLMKLNFIKNIFKRNQIHKKKNIKNQSEEDIKNNEINQNKIGTSQNIKKNMQAQNNIQQQEFIIEFEQQNGRKNVRQL